jgi:phage terminase large subunit
MARIIIPYKPREIFKPFHNRTQRWSIEVDHRRCGKTVSRVNDLIRKALSHKGDKPRFAYIAPLLKQAKSVAWEYMKTYSAPFLAHGAKINESELRIDYAGGAQVRIHGADNPEALRGIYLDGVVLDEFSDMDPGIWPVIRPALSDRQGMGGFHWNAEG